jgi:hypothetical protein
MVKTECLTMTKGGGAGDYSGDILAYGSELTDYINQLTGRLWLGVRLFLIEPGRFMKGRGHDFNRRNGTGAPNEIIERGGNGAPGQ